MKHGLNLADLLEHARVLGIGVKHLRRTGEVQFSHSTQSRRARFNGRRKDAPRHASAFVSRVEQAVALDTFATFRSAAVENAPKREA